MGMLKRMKDVRHMVEAAPGMVAQAQQLSAQAQQMGAAQQAAYQAQAGQALGAQPGGFAECADFDPITGVSIEQFASVSKGVAAFGYDTKLPEIAASKRISAADWQTAPQGWNERIKRTRAVAQRRALRHRQPVLKRGRAPDHDRHLRRPDRRRVLRRR